MKIVPAIKAKDARLIGVMENENLRLAQASDPMMKVEVDTDEDDEGGSI